MTGTVTEFDDAVGLGTITANDGTAYAFHCTAIADGTRAIAPDTPVKFRLVPGPLGALEAIAVKPVE